MRVRDRHPVQARVDQERALRRAHEAPPPVVPDLEAVAMAQRDSIDGLLLGSFRKTGEARGDLFILQLRGTEPGTYGCGPGAQGPRCYGHLYIGVDSEQPLSAQEVYAVTSGDVVLSAVGPALALSSASEPCGRNTAECPRGTVRRADS